MTSMTRLGGIAAVWTDFGGVLTPSTEASLAAFCARIGVPVAVFGAAVATVTASYGVQDPMAPLDTPLVSEHDWARQVERELAALGVPVDLGDPGALWFADRPVNLDWLAWLDTLRRNGIFVGLLSNMVPTWDRHWQRMVPAEFFDGVVLSHRVGARKPADEIFAYAVEVAGVPGSACVLVDDLAVNCVGAAAAGWRAIEFTDTASAVHRLAALTGIPAAPHQTCAVPA